MNSSQDTLAHSYSYVGNELELFAEAVHWKRYFRSAIADRLVGDVLEVGAGIGETARHLLDGRQRSSPTSAWQRGCGHGQKQATLHRGPPCRSVPQQT